MFRSRNNFMLIAVLLAACGGPTATTEEAEPIGTSGGEGQTEVTAEQDAPVAWHDMDQQQRAGFMMEVVMPEMQTLFQEFDGERFAEFNCATCHGENMREVNMEMPNGLAPLDPAQVPAMFESDQPMAQFMTQRVWPKMGELLGEELYDMETQQGFSCMHCHGTAEAAAAKTY